MCINVEHGNVSKFYFGMAQFNAMKNFNYSLMYLFSYRFDANYEWYIPKESSQKSILKKFRQTVIVICPVNFK